MHRAVFEAEAAGELASCECRAGSGRASCASSVRALAVRAPCVLGGGLAVFDAFVERIAVSP